MAAPSMIDGARMFVQVAQELAVQDDVRAASERVVQLARTILACDSAAIWSLTALDAVKLQSATDPVLAEHFGQLVGQVREGLAWDCLHGHSVLRVGDFSTDRRWPDYRCGVLRSADPVRSAVGYPLGTGERQLGVLIVTSRQPDFFTDELTEVGAIFAQHATLSLDAVAAQERVRNLETALGSNRRIGMAIGIVMASYRLQDEQAFDLLRVASQQGHRKLREVAEDVILTGALPVTPLLNAVS
ncbi:MAG: GAF and ANTAR domain-containing protein [Jatrophihabitans sp.]